MGMNRAMMCLEKRTYPGWQPYPRFRDTLNEVGLPYSGDQVRVRFRSPKHDTSATEDDPYDVWSTSFIVTDAGEVYQRPQNRNQGPNHLYQLMKLPYTHSDAIRTKIMDFATVSQDPITYDLDARTISEPLPSILVISKTLRRHALNRFACNEIAVQMTTTKIKATFGKFKALEGWICTRLP